MTAALGLSSRGGPRVTPGAAVLAVIVMALLLACVVPLRTYLEQRGQLGRLDQRIELLTRQNSQLERRIELLRDPSYIERTARRCYGMARPGEITFIVVPERGPARPPVC